MNNQWGWALALVLFGAATDFFDGIVARWLLATSDFGKRWVDPLCDFGFALGVLAGFAFYDEDYKWRLLGAIVIIASAIMLKLAKEQQHYRRVQRVCYGLSPIYYCTCAVGFIYFFLNKFFSSETMNVISAVWLALTILAAYVKRDRFRDWLGKSRKPAL